MFPLNQYKPALTEFICQAQSPLVMAIDGAWGTGKTTFLQMWSQKLRQRGCICLEFSAWETDFATDPLVALVGEISMQLEAVSSEVSQDADYRKLLDKLRRQASIIARVGASMLFRIAFRYAVNLPSELEQELATSARQFAEHQVDLYEKTKREMEDFRKTLTDFVAKLQAGSSTPFVIFVDELDRCRPSYAIELLERIKHLFTIEGVTFVLGIDRAQLSHAAGVLYGASFNSREYLRRFIDIEYTLPPANHADFQASIFVTFGLDAVLQAKTGKARTNYTLQLLGVLFKAARLTPRQLTQVLGYLRAVLQIIAAGAPVLEVTLSLLLVTRVCNEDSYARMLDEREFTLHDVFDRTKLTGRETSLFRVVELVIASKALNLDKVRSQLSDQDRKDGVLMKCIDTFSDFNAADALEPTQRRMEFLDNVVHSASI